MHLIGNEHFWKLASIVIDINAVEVLKRQAM